MIAETTNSQNSIYSGADFLAALELYGELYDVDTTAALAIAAASGLNGNPSPDGYGYGPFWIDLRANDLPQLAPIKPYDSKLNTWAWSDNGIQYAARRMWQAGASGLGGGDAIEAMLAALYPGNVTADTALDVASMYVRIIEAPEAQLNELSQYATGPTVTEIGMSGQDSSSFNFNYTLTQFENIKNIWAHKIPKFSADMTNIGTAIERLLQ